MRYQKLDKKIRFLVLLFILLSHSIKSFSLTITTEDQYPWSFSTDGGKTIEGIASDTIKTIMNLSKTTYTMTAYPWSRAYRMGETDKDTCVFPTARTEKRENTFKWIGPIGHNTFTLFANKDSPIVINKLEDAKKYTLGANMDSAILEYLKKDNFTNIYEVSDSKKLLTMLINNRLDLWASNKFEALKLSSTENKEIVNKIEFGKTDLYLACNKSVSDSSIKELNNTLNTITKNGTLK